MTHAKETIVSPNHPFRKGYGTYFLRITLEKGTESVILGIEIAY
jgi:hypothetical protein